MKLFYYQRPDGQSNFGDELNRWLWPQLKGRFFDGRSSSLFVGIGTLLNDKLVERTDAADRVIVFSTGAGYEQSVETIPAHWDIHCLRGPLSAKRLGLPEQLAITDGALLTAQVYPAATERCGASFMPHVHHASEASAAWQRICEMVGIRYIDPRWPVERVLSAIASSECVLAEAMHGAIVADALRVPWIPMTTGPRIYSFKWQDWCASMDVFYHPYHVPTLQQYKRYGRGVRSGRHAFRHWCHAFLEGPVSTSQYQLLADEPAIARRLANIAMQAPTLSRQAVFDVRFDQLLEGFDRLCSQYQQSPVVAGVAG